MSIIGLSQVDFVCEFEGACILRMSSTDGTVRAFQLDQSAILQIAADLKRASDQMFQFSEPVEQGSVGTELVVVVGLADSPTEPHSSTSPSRPQPVAVSG